MLHALLGVHSACIVTTVKLSRYDNYSRIEMSVEHTGREKQVLRCLANAVAKSVLCAAVEFPALKASAKNISCKFALLPLACLSVNSSFTALENRAQDRQQRLLYIQHTSKRMKTYLS